MLNKKKQRIAYAKDTDVDIITLSPGVWAK